MFLCVRIYLREFHLLFRNWKIMTVKVYITRDAKTNSEKGFEHDYERLAALQIAKSVWRKYQASKTYYAILANISNPPIDLLILSNNGIGIAELKNYNGTLKGTGDSEWYTVDKSGKNLVALKSGGHTNPFQQVRDYRRRVFQMMNEFAQKNSSRIPRWLGENFHMQASVIFTGPPVDISRITLDPKVSKPWFSFRYLDGVPDWSYSLSFGKNLKLGSSELEVLVTELFRTSEWTEISGNLNSIEVYGVLWILIDGLEAFPLRLDQDEMSIGRDPTNSLMLTEDFFKVSRDHALVRRTAMGPILFDKDSKHGTWVNGNRLVSDAGHTLKSGDRIVFGQYNTGEAVLGSCEVVYKATPRNISATVSE